MRRQRKGSSEGVWLWSLGIAMGAFIGWAVILLEGHHASYRCMKGRPAQALTATFGHPTKWTRYDEHTEVLEWTVPVQGWMQCNIITDAQGRDQVVPVNIPPHVGIRQAVVRDGVCIAYASGQ